MSLSLNPTFNCWHSVTTATLMATRLRSDALLVVEAADTSLAYDRNYKSVVYSMRGVPELWILDVNRPRLFVMREPAELGYRVVMELEAGDAIAPLALPELSFAVADLLGPLL